MQHHDRQASHNYTTAKYEMEEKKFRVNELQVNAVNGPRKVSMDFDENVSHSISKKTSDQNILRNEIPNQDQKVFQYREKALVQNLRFMQPEQNSVPDSNQFSDSAGSNIALVENVDLNMTKSDINSFRVSTLELLQRKQSLTK